MNSCLRGGGGATYRLDLDIIKPSPSPAATLMRTCQSPMQSPSSTISGLSDSAECISTRKPRSARKRLNQKYNEAAALLSSACPKVFSSRHILKPCRFRKTASEFASLEEAESAEVLVTFPGFDERQSFQFEPKVIIGSPTNPLNCINLCNVCDLKGDDDDLDTESILDEEIEEGIDSIMGSMIVSFEEANLGDETRSNLCYGYPLMGFGFDFGFRFMSRRMSAFRNVDHEGDSFPFVNIGEISPRFQPKSCTQKKQKKKKVEDIIKSASQCAYPNSPSPSSEDPAPEVSDSPRLLLKLNYNEVLMAWLDRGSPFSDRNLGAGGLDSKARLGQIDLFGDNVTGVVREASVQRYKEKRHARLFSKKIRYQVRKVNADQRPQTQVRFASAPDSTDMPPDDAKRTKQKRRS
ncbi:CHLOROPLAST IMPORT APPARATUS 2-like protein [Drosera capensis]